MSTKIKTYGIMIITAVLLVAMAFAGAASAGLPAATYVEVNSWAGLNKSVAEWTDTTEARTVAVNASITDRLLNENEHGIYVYGNVIVTTTASPVYSGNDVLINGSSQGRIFNVTSTGNLTICKNSTGSVMLNLTGGTGTDAGGNTLGGAVNVIGGNFTLSTGAKITYCFASVGGGVYTYGGTCNINGGTITDCYAFNNGGGGGVHVWDSTFTMLEGTISRCNAPNGGGISLMHNTIGTMTDGIITACNATDTQGTGGGIFLNEAKIVIDGGSITNCNATYGGGGVSLSNGGKLEMTGNCIISGNTAGIYGKEVLSGGCYSPINLSGNVHIGDGTGSDFAIRSFGYPGYEPYLNINSGAFSGLIENITLYNSTWVENVSAWVGQVVVNGSTDTTKFKLSTSPIYSGYQLKANGNDLVLAEKQITYVEVNNWAGLNKSIAEWTDTDEARTVAVNASILNRVAGNNTYGIDVKGKIILTTNASPVGNEAVINGNGYGRLFQIQNGGNLTLVGNGTSVLNLTGGNTSILSSSNYGGAIFDKGNLTINNGVKITNCSADEGGAVLIYDNCNFIMNDGSIADCTAINGSGGVQINYKAEFTMNGGSITDCTTDNVGGGVYVRGGMFTMTNGSITDCTAKDGGGVYSYTTFTMTGGSITECSAISDETYNGGGVAASGNFNVSGDATVTNNKRNGVTSNVAVDGESLTLVGPFSGTIGITPKNAIASAGVPFGLAPVTYSGAENFVADANANLVGSISNGELVWKDTTPTPSYSSSSKHSGYTQILSQGQVAPTPYATTTPTVAPTAKPTTVVNPTAKPTTQATTQPTQSSPAPVAGLIAGLGAAALVLARLRR